MRGTQHAYQPSNSTALDQSTHCVSVAIQSSCLHAEGAVYSYWPTIESNVFMPTSCGHGVDSITTASAFEICMRTLERCIRRLVLARLSQLGNPQSSPRMAGLNSACRQRRRKKGVVLSHHTAAQPPLFWPALQTHNHRRLLCQVRSDQLHIVTTSR